MCPLPSLYTAIQLANSYFAEFTVILLHIHYPGYNPWTLCYGHTAPERFDREGNTENENNGYVVFKRNIHGSLENRVVRVEQLLRPPPSISTAELLTDN